MTFYLFVTYLRRVDRTRNRSFSRSLHGYPSIRDTETNARSSAVRSSRTMVWVGGDGLWVDGTGSPGFRLGAVDKTKYLLNDRLVPASPYPYVHDALERISKYFLTTNSRLHPPRYARRTYRHVYCTATPPIHTVIDFALTISVRIDCPTINPAFNGLLSPLHHPRNRLRI